MTYSEDVITMHQANVIPTYAPGMVLVKGSGAKVWDADGREYLDFLAGISVLNVGHCHPSVVKAISDQAGKLMHVSNLYYNELQPKLAQKLISLSMDGKCFFCNSGAEANESLIKLARLWGSKQDRFEIVSMTNSFHGRTLAALAATGQTKYQVGFEPMPPGFKYAEFNDLESVKATVSDKTAAVLVEAVQGEGGIVPADTDFMQGVRQLCDEQGILMLCDEVQCGMGRTGRWFGFQNYDVVPDAFSIAKALGNGFPIGAIVAGPKLSDVFQPGKHASTFGGTPLASAAALATIDVIEQEGLVARAGEKSALFRKGLEEIASKHERVSSIRGLGLMLGIVLDRPAKRLVEIMLEKGLISIATADVVARFLPPLIISDEDIEAALEITEASLKAWEAEE